MILQRIGSVLGDLFESVTKFLIRKRITFVEQFPEIRKDLLDCLNVLLVAVDEQLIASGPDTDIEERFEIFNVLVLNAEQRIEALWW